MNDSKRFLDLSHRKVSIRRIAALSGLRSLRSHLTRVWRWILHAAAIWFMVSSRSSLADLTSKGKVGLRSDANDAGKAGKAGRCQPFIGELNDLADFGLDGRFHGNNATTSEFKLDAVRPKADKDAIVVTDRLFLVLNAAGCNDDTFATGRYNLLVKLFELFNRYYANLFDGLGVFAGKLAVKDHEFNFFPLVTGGLAHHNGAGLVESVSFDPQLAGEFPARKIGQPPFRRVDSAAGPGFEFASIPSGLNAVVFFAHGCVFDALVCESFHGH